METKEQRINPIPHFRAGYKKAIRDMINFMQIESYEVGSEEYNKGFEYAEKYYLKYLNNKLKELK